MSDRQSVIEVLTKAVEANPNDVSLRLHLVSLLLEDNECEKALEQASAVLNLQPDNLEALEKAARAAELSGQIEKAKGYKRLRDALGGNKDAEQKAITPFDDFTDDILFNEFIDDEPKTPISVGPMFDFDEDFDDKQFDDLLLDDEDEIWEVEEPNIKLDDVAGMEKVKERLQMAFLAPLKNPELMKFYGKSLRGGLLLYGPPGCGKTFIARATAGELGAKFISVGLSDVLDMWLGNSEKNLHEIFERARRKAPCVLFFDELDAVGRKRSLVRYSGVSGVVNQLLSEMDSVGNNNEGVFILAATNHPWDVDTALRRPGRLDRMLLVLPPDKPAREAVLRYHLRERPVDKLDLEAIAKITDGFSGADVAHLCESAAELAMSDSIKTGKVRPINMNDFKQAMKGINPSTRPWFETARNFALFANEGGIYDDLVDYLKSQRML